MTLAAPLLEELLLEELATGAGPDQVLDAAEEIEALVDVAGHRVVAGIRPSSVYVRPGCGSVDFDEGVQAEVAVIGQLRDAVVVDERADPAQRIVHAAGRTVVEVQHSAVGVGHGRRADRVGTAVGEKKRTELVVGGWGTSFFERACVLFSFSTVQWGPG